MDLDKMRKWLEITNEYKQNDFWTNVLKYKAPEQFLIPTPIRSFTTFIKMKKIILSLWKCPVCMRKN